jgi:hypothetical protein
VPSTITPRTPIFIALVASNSPNPEFVTFDCVFITTMSPGEASESALCSIKLSPAWHHTVSAAPTIRGECQIGLIPTSIAPIRDMQSATCALEPRANAASSGASGRCHPVRTRNPTFPAILDFLLRIKTED